MRCKAFGTVAQGAFAAAILGMLSCEGRRRELHLVPNGCTLRLGEREGHPMERYGAIWDVAAGTFIAVSLFSGMAYIIASALH
jgi:hypothetical protein